MPGEGEPAPTAREAGAPKHLPSPDPGTTMRAMLRLLFCLLLAGCSTALPTDDDDSATPDDDDSATSDDDDAVDDDDAADDDDTPVPNELPGYSGEACPTMVEGTNSGWESYGMDRQFQLLLPDEPEGAPLVFVWHWLGGTAGQINGALRVTDWVDDGAVVISPESTGLQFEWDTLGSVTDNRDLTLFDDLLTCASEQFGIDRNRVHSTGMSAGGLWTTVLTMQRAEFHASTAPLSGGAQDAFYSSPAEPIPVLVTWGGPGDLYNGFSFEDVSEAFVRNLRADGHFVPECVHSLGHTIAPGSAEAVWRFFQDHPRGLIEEPYADELPASFPDFCDLQITQ